MTGEDERQFARALISQVLEEHARGEIGLGRTPPTVEEEEALAAGIHAALFGVGRLQPLLDDPEVENIDINGCDRVFVSYADGQELMHDPVAESDEELTELIQILAAYSGLSSLAVRHRQPATRPAPARRVPVERGDGRDGTARGVDQACPARQSLSFRLSRK
ncbi:hypothetical protein ACFSTC_49885 [Nonomuraea ferruginea]